MTRHGHVPAARQTGISLVELMVAMVVGLLLLGGITRIYVSNQQSFIALEQLSRMQETGRFAMDMINQDLRRAGYWGGNVDLTTNGGDPGPATPAHTCADDNAWGRMMAWRVSGRDNTNAGYGCATDYLADTDIVTMRYAGPEPVASAAVSGDGGLYLQSTLFMGWVMTGALRNTAGNTPPAEIATAPEHLRPEVRRMVSNAYYVGDSGRTCPSGDVIPALRRVSLDPATGRPVVEEVASGVEQLQVRYLVDGAYRDAGAISDDEWRNVSAVRVWVLVRGECPEPDLLNDTVYAMGDTVWPPAPDNFRRQLYSSTVMLRNQMVR
jgi:type IV pilus assembly protein PilW